MIITSEITTNSGGELFQITKITIAFEENSDYQFDKYQIICIFFLVILFIICNIIIIICLRK